MIPQDQQRIIIAMTLSVPLSYFMRSIKGRLAKQIYSIILGTVLQFYVYGSDIPYIFIVHALMYTICYSFPKKCGAIVTLLSLSILSSYHIYRMIINYGSWTLDVSTVLMTITCKYSMVAYQIQDGVQNEDKLTPEQKQNCIKKIPNILSFLSYCQFLPTAVIGTAIQYTKYEKYVMENGDFKQIPSPWKQVAKDMGYALILAAIYFLFGQMLFPLSAMKDQSYPNNSLWYLVMFSFFSVTFLRFKYYFAWKFSMGAVHASGISYQSYTDKNIIIKNFEGVQTCNPEIVETTLHLRDKIANWNMSTQLWLRKCIYQRSPFKSKAIGQLYTFMISSFWHGFYGGYYISFFFWFCQTHLQHMIFKLSKNQNNSYVKIYKKFGIIGKIALWIGANVLFTVNGVYFQVLSLKHGMKIMIGMYFVPTIIVIGLIVLFTVYPGSKKSKSIRDKPTQIPSLNHSKKSSQKTQISPQKKTPIKIE